MKSYGYIETYGYVASIVSADIALKTADVELTNLYFVKGGIVTIELTGDLSAVSSAIDAGVEEAKKLDKYLSSNVIASPDRELQVIIGDDTNGSNESNDVKNNFKEKEAVDESSENELTEEKLTNVDLVVNESNNGSLDSSISSSELEIVEEIDDEEISEIIDDIINESESYEKTGKKEDYDKMSIIELKQKVNEIGKYKWSEIKSMKKTQLIDILKNEK